MFLYLYIYCPRSSEVNVGIVLFIFSFCIKHFDWRLLLFCMTYNVPCLIFLNMFCIVLYAYTLISLYIYVNNWLILSPWRFFLTPRQLLFSQRKAAFSFVVWMDFAFGNVISPCTLCIFYMGVPFRNCLIKFTVWQNQLLYSNCFQNVYHKALWYLFCNAEPSAVTLYVGTNRRPPSLMLSEPDFKRLFGSETQNFRLYTFINDKSLGQWKVLCMIFHGLQ